MATAPNPIRTAKTPPRASGGRPFLGHLLELRRAPIALMQRVHDECGELGEIRLANHPVVMLYGEEAQRAFFRAPDEQLDQASAYPFMTPIFGEGVVFDATPEQRKQALRNQSLRDQQMRGHAEGIAAETERMIEGWGESGEVDLLDFLSELTIYTSSACLLGPEFRADLTPDFAKYYHDLEAGTDAFAYVNPYLPLPSFWRRDRARRKLVEGIQAILDRRKAEGREPRDLVQVLTKLRNEDGTPRYTTDQITGMFISMMFAGHHTTSSTAAWLLIELLHHPEVMGGVVSELDALYADGRNVSYHALREMPSTEAAIKEALRLHPPLIILMRKVQEDFFHGGFRVEAGKTVAVSPAVSNRMPEYFPEPERFLPERYAPGREEDKQGFTWLPFGAGRHRCVGAAFAMMQLKAIFSVLLRRFEFEPAQPAESYRNDHSKMVVQLARPCRVRYRERRAETRTAKTAAGAAVGAASGAERIEVDFDLCQGHGVCVSEAPLHFGLDEAAQKVMLLRSDSEIDPADRAAVEAAVRYCPARALALGRGAPSSASPTPSKAAPPPEKGT